MHGNLYPSWKGEGRHELNLCEKTTTSSSDHLSPNKTSISKFVQSIALIAGTTVGGGFLALPSTVVVPLGGFVPSAAALVLVWAYLLVCSLILCDGIVMAQQQEKDSTGPMGIPRTAQRALGRSGSRVASILLVSLMLATLVSQLSRAGSLYASQLLINKTTSSTTKMKQYRIGCAIATFLGSLVTHGRHTDATDPRQKEQKEPTTHTSFADKFNAALTTVFLSSAVLLFRSGSKVADWSACWKIPSTTIGVLPKMLQASPIMLQLLVYGEILPNVCEMLKYKKPSIRWAVLLGSFIPLLLLTGWAALGVALIPTAAKSAKVVDPVEVLLTAGGSTRAVQARLLTLAISAIGTTILGSFLALQSAYGDWQSMLPTNRRQFWKNGWVQTLAISVPPLLISCISPSVFLQAIDFAGSYPVLLLYGVLPPMILRKLVRKQDNALPSNKVYNMIGVFSAGLVGINILADCSSMVRRIMLKS